MDAIGAMMNTVMTGNCLELLPELPDGCVDLVLCDLPYGLTRNRWDRPIDLGRLWPLYDRVVKENGAVVLFGVGAFTGELIMSNVPAFRYKMVWIKMKPTNFLNSRIQPLRKHEDICVFYRKQPVYQKQMQRGKPYDKGSDFSAKSSNYNGYTARRKKSNDGKRHPSDVLLLEEDQPGDWFYCKTPNKATELLHPTQKPVELCRYLVRTYTLSGAVVLDNACGSGSTLVAAVLEGRQFIGIEQEKEYVQAARDRIKVAFTDAGNEAKKLLLFK